MITKYFDFKEALDYMEAGDIVGLNTDKERLYYREGNDFWCIPNKENLNTKYKVTKFYTDAILSTDWYIVEEKA